MEKRKHFIIKCVLFLLISICCSFALLSCKSDTKEPEQDPGYRTMTIYELYAGTENFSFAKITVTSVKDVIYSDVLHTDIRYLILEGVVEEDYYCKLEKDTVVDIPILLNKKSDTYFDENVVADLFFQSKTLFVYFREADDNELQVYPEGEKVQFDYLTSRVVLDFSDMILCANGKTDLKMMSDFLDSQDASYVPFNLYGDYTRYIDDLMDINTVSNNLKTLYEIIKNKQK
ncbi:MAG: hypothetical protein J1F33_08145 [Clostridiales bacterium]|nr:hypothetical protein [Clostridiales bacterium]